MSEQEYDYFESMMGEIQRFSRTYHSFVTDKTYQDIMDKTASGLLADAILTTGSLTNEQLRRHENAKELFAAWLMFFCAMAVQKSRFRNKINLSWQDACDINLTVYRRILKRLKRDWDHGNGQFQHARTLIIGSAKNEIKSLLRRYNWNEVPLNGNIVSCSEDADVSPEEQRATEALAVMADNACRYEQTKALVTQAFMECRARKFFTDEDFSIVCWHLGLGDFDLLNNGEIARKLGRSDGYVTRRRKAALETFRKYLRNTPKWKDTLL